MSNTKYEIRLLRLAEDDLTEIILYVAADRSSAAVKLMTNFSRKLTLLEDNPLIGNVPHEDSLRQLGYRYLLVENYLVFYIVESSVVYAHRIIHGARDYVKRL